MQNYSLLSFFSGFRDIILHTFGVEFRAQGLRFSSYPWDRKPPQSWYKSYGFRALELRATETLRSKVSINCRLGSRGTRRC